MRYFAQICSDYRRRCKLAQNMNNWWDWFITWATLALFYWTVVAIHLSIHPIFIEWWVPIIALWGGAAISGRCFYHHDLRGPAVKILWFIGVMALMPYLCVYHWDFLLQADALGKGLRGMLTTVILHPIFPEWVPYDGRSANFAWWAHLPPCWVVTVMVSSFIWFHRNEWRFLLEAPRWNALGKNWCGYPLPDEWGFKPY